MIIKEIIYDIDTGLLWLFDSKGSKYQCNLYGNHLKRFIPDISGVASATERKQRQRLNAKEGLFDLVALSPKGIDYYPTSNKFECYSQYPRPLVRPLSNINYSKHNERLRRKLVDILQLNYSSSKAMRAFKNEDPNSNRPHTVKTLTFSTSKLAKEHMYMVDTKKILGLIDNTFASMFEGKVDWEIDIIKHQVKYKALKKLKLFLQANDYDINVYRCGLKLNQPSTNIKRLYSAVNKMINKTGINQEQRREEEDLPIKKATYRPTSAVTQRRPTELKGNLSFLSKSNDSTDKEMVVKTEKNIRCITEYQEKHLKGYRPPAVKQRPIIRKDHIKFKTNLDLYLKECDLVSKVNPALIWLQNEKKKFDEEILNRKKQQTIVRLKGLGYKFNKNV